MTNETLIPFDPEIAVKHPERVRSLGLQSGFSDSALSTCALEVVRFKSCDDIAILWDGDDFAVAYDPNEIQMQLRLTSATKTVMVQCYRYKDANAVVDFLPLGRPLSLEHWQPIGDPQPFEVPE